MAELGHLDSDRLALVDPLAKSRYDGLVAIVSAEACFEDQTSDNGTMSRRRRISLLCTSMIGSASSAGGNTYD